MSTLATIRAAIAAKAAAVPDFGVVHNRERFDAGSESKFKDLFVYELAGGAKQLRGWWLRRVATEELAIAFGRTVDVHTWQMRGYMAFADADASELVFDELVEAFRDAVRADPTFGGVCEAEPMGDDARVPQNVQVLDAGPVRFCGVLCHSAVLQLRTWSYQ
ncbi:MAG TPA: hypothetical protein VLK85_20010 [Ramlibacter sp.]|nr:hypothetical protein [Ramlibacter sp.]